MTTVVKHTMGIWFLWVCIVCDYVAYMQVVYYLQAANPVSSMGTFVCQKSAVVLVWISLNTKEIVQLTLTINKPEYK